MTAAMQRIGAAGGILAVLVGIPGLLWLLARQLLPPSIPSAQDVLSALSHPDDGSMLAGILLTAAAIVWAQLALSIVAELAAVVRRRPGVRVELPGLGVSRLLASVLVAGLLGAGASNASAAPARPVAALAALAPTAKPAEQPADGPRYLVKPRDTLWRIAESELGDPLRWREIYALNVGIVQPDGGRLTDATLLRTGWMLILPAVDHDVVVRPGDTLSGIAARDLHDSRLTGDLFATNKGHLQPDGQRLRDPDLIQPGWTLTMPTADRPAEQPDAPRPTTVPVPGSVIPNPTAPPLAPPSPAAPGPSSVPPPAAGTQAAPVTPTPGPVAEATPEPPRGAASPASSPVPIPGSGAAAPETGSDGQPALTPVSAALGVSSLVITGLLGALAVRRRRQLRQRRPRHRIAVPDTTAGRLEWTVAHAAPSLDAAVLDAA